MLTSMATVKLDNEQEQPDYDEAQDVSYEDEEQPDFDAVAAPDYDEVSQDAEADAGSQEWRARSQK
jgi:hypothetical protein